MREKSCQVRGTRTISPSRKQLRRTSPSAPHRMWVGHQYAQYGRWISPDPAGVGAVGLSDPQSWNRYAYVLNDPIDSFDLMGLQSAPGVKWYEQTIDPFTFHWWVLQTSGGSFAGQEGNVSTGVPSWWPALAVDATWWMLDNSVDPAAANNGVKAATKCPAQKQAFFNTLGPIFTDMAREANTDPNFIAALSAYESAWLGPHAQELNNPFGLTKAGGNDLSFKSYADAADYWMYSAGRDANGYASLVSGTTTINAFLSAAQNGGYNAATKSWASDIANVYRTSIVPFAGVCGF